MSDEGVLSDGALTDPNSSMQIIIEDSTGTEVQALADMNKDADGKYSYVEYTIPADANLGIWNWEARATTTTPTVAIARSSFIVEEQVA